jgi:chromosomal replication initiator protein
MSKEKWILVLEDLSLSLSPYNFKNWIKPLRFISFDGSQVVVETPGKFFYDWINDKYFPFINVACQKFFGEECSLTISCGLEEKITSSPVVANSSSLESVLRERNLNPRYTFDSFVPGAGNEFAYAACQRVASAPGRTSYNPLFIFGGVGLGKTHLLHSIAIEILSNYDSASVFYLSSERFTNELINAIRFERMEDFRQKYRRRLSAILIDDIQFLADKERTQEEFFHTFNSLYESGCQIVVTSDKFPKDIKGLEERLKSRLNWGLVADIKAPDTETKAAILAKKADHECFDLPHDVALFIASNINGNVRDLEGALIRLEAFCSLTKTPVTIDAATECLKNILKQKNAIVTIDTIQRSVSDFYDLEVSDMKSPRRNKHIALPRQVAIYLSRHFTSASTTTIGEKFGGRDHTTVLYAIKKIRGKIESDDSFKERVETITQIIAN